MQHEGFIMLDKNEPELEIEYVYANSLLWPHH
jgi:hypothetical protein